MLEKSLSAATTRFRALSPELGSAKIISIDSRTDEEEADREAQHANVLVGMLSRTQVAKNGRYVRGEDRIVLELVRRSEQERVNGNRRDIFLLSPVQDNPVFPMPTKVYDGLSADILRRSSKREVRDVPLLTYKNSEDAARILTDILEFVSETWNEPLIPPPLPAQTLGPHFTLSETTQVTLVPPADLDQDGNNTRRLEQLLPQARQAAADLLSHGQSLGNQFPQLVRDVERYAQIIAPSLEKIDWSLLWGAGVRIETAGAAAERAITDRLYPDLEDAPLAALQALRQFHGPLILSTREGAELQELSDQMVMTDKQQDALWTAGEALASDLRQHEELIELSAAETVTEAVETSGPGPQRKRGATYAVVVLKNVAIVTIGAAVALGIKATANDFAGDAASMAVWETIKKWPAFARAVNDLGDNIQAVKEGAPQALEAAKTRLTPFRSFVARNREPLRAIAGSTPQLLWLLRYIDYVTERSDQPHEAGFARVVRTGSSSAPLSPAPASEAPSAVVVETTEDRTDAETRPGGAGFQPNVSSRHYSIVEQSFDYSSNDGHLTISTPDGTFHLRFAKRSDTQIYLIKFGNTARLARTKGVQPGDLVVMSSLDSSSSIYHIGIGEVFLVENSTGDLLVGRITHIADDTRNNAPADEVRFVFTTWSKGTLASAP